MPPSPARSPRPVTLFYLAAGVLALHAWLLHTFYGALLTRTGATAPAQRVAVRLLPAAPPAALTPPPTPQRTPPPQNAQASTGHPHSSKTPRPAPAPVAAPPLPSTRRGEEDRATALLNTLLNTPQPTTPAEQPPNSALAATSQPELPSTAPDSAQPLTDTQAQALHAQAPPLYPVRLPPAQTLNYRSTQGAQTGQAQLRWTHDGQHYQLEQSQHSPGRPAHSWVSRGTLETSAEGQGGLAPERLLERRRKRPVQAVNFQRDKGLLSYSASALTAPLYTGTQDRASWLVQLAGIVQAAQASPAPLREGDRVSLLVASPRGQLDAWVFQLQAATATETGLIHLLREPVRPYDWRMELWLAPRLHYLPQRLRWQLLPGGEAILWELEPAVLAPNP